jgi:cation transporter-like permease
MSVWMGVGFLFYGLIFMSDIYSGSAVTVFAGIFVSGGFLFGFGQYVPSWDSSYYPLMMSQNVAYKEYLASKWWLVVVGTLIGMVLSSFYVFFDWEMYLAILAGGIYNLGINAYLVLLSGAYTRTPIDLTTNNKAFGDKRSFNIKTLLLSIPKLVVPMFVYYVGVLIQSKSFGLILVALVGVLGFAFRNLVFGWIEKIYQEEKHKTLQAYKQKNT